GEVAVEGGGAAVGHLPTLALGREAQVLHPHGLVPAEGDVDLGAVDLAPGIGDAGLGIEVGGAVPSRPGVDRVPPGEHGGLAAHGRAHDPGRVGRAPGRGLVHEDHGAGAVGGGAGLEVADGVPEHGRLGHLLEADVLYLEVGVGVAQGVLPVLHPHHDPDVVGGAGTTYI